MGRKRTSVPGAQNAIFARKWILREPIHHLSFVFQLSSHEAAALSQSLLGVVEIKKHAKTNTWL
jgi:hypothetical protein